MKRDNPRYEVKGKIWFGNKGYYFDNVSSEDDKEEKAKEEFVRQKMPDIGNFSLFMDKYVPIIEASITDRGKNKTETWLSIKSKSMEEESKKIFLNCLIEKTKNKGDVFNFSQAATKLKEYVEKIKDNLKNQHYEEVICQFFTTKSRLVVGLGSSHVLETALTLHHIYGIPYIPGSALKGVCRAVAFWKLAKDKGILNNQDEIKKLSEKFYGKLFGNDNDILTYQLLFGAQDFRGLLLFLDAYPIIDENTEIFELDIMNVHYPGYYGDNSGQTPPGDWENPTPIYFLTVRPGIGFHICVLFDKWRWEQIKNKEPFSKVDVGNIIKSELENIIKTALNQFGIGAKGRLGYGILE